MNDLSQSQFDDFLNFSDLFLLTVSLQGNLYSLRPRGKDFLGWNNKNRRLFDFTGHFLQPNHLTLKLFLDLLSEKDYALDVFVWKNLKNEISHPLPAFVRFTNEEGKQKNILIFVKNPCQATQINLPASDKKYIYQGRVLPGFIHNINGPFGTMTGRIELLQYQHPEIKEFDEIIRVGYRLQSIIDNASFKIINENHEKESSINLNRFLREEIGYLNNDLFFKHQVEKVDELTKDIPEFKAHYFSLSGIFSECYQFFRQFVDEHTEYVCIVKSFMTENQIGFSMDFLGEFFIHGKQGAKLPLYFEGDYIEMIRLMQPGLDTKLLAYCMERSRGILRLSCTPEALKYRYDFPQP